MGYGRYDPKEWSSYSSTVSSKSTAEIFTSSKLDTDLNPKDVIRESRDSDLNPNSNAIIVNVDVTGSMGSLADNLVRKGVGVLYQEIIDRQSVSDPHLMITANGDYTQRDRSPFQASQFETDMTITKWLEKVHIEHGGGGNHFESYDMPYLFAARRTTIDCFEKRGKKGYLFTIGDEPPPSVTNAKRAKDILGDDIGLQDDLPFSAVIEEAQRMYYTYHLIVTEGSYPRTRGLEAVRMPWTNLLGQNVVLLDDIKDLSEVIVSIIEVNEGTDAEAVATSWDGSTEMVVRNAVKGLTPAERFDAAKDVVRL